MTTNWSPIGSEDDRPAHAALFRCSDDVRHWRVLQALANHPAGDYSANAADVTKAFDQMILGIKNLKILLDYAPPRDVYFDVPSVRNPLHIQGMLYWCAKLHCTLEELYEAHANCGSGALIEAIQREVIEIQRRNVSDAWSRASTTPNLKSSAAGE